MWLKWRNELGRVRACLCRRKGGLGSDYFLRWVGAFFLGYSWRVGWGLEVLRWFLWRFLWSSVSF